MNNNEENSKNDIILAASHLSFSYGDTPVLSDVSFCLGRKEKLGVVGANGAGKTTLLKLPLFLLPDFSGELVLNGNIVTKKQAGLARKTIGYIFQDSDNQLFCNTIEKELAFAPRKLGLSNAEAEERSRAVAECLGIQHLMPRQPHTLSGGEKKLVSIACVLTTEPQILFFDEPSTALDPKNRRNLIRILGELPQSMLIASHDFDLLCAFCDRVLILADGHILKEGDPKQLLKDTALLERAGL